MGREQPVDQRDELRRITPLAPLHAEVDVDVAIPLALHREAAIVEVHRDDVGSDQLTSASRDPAPGKRTVAESATTTGGA